MVDVKHLRLTIDDLEIWRVSGSRGLRGFGGGVEMMEMSLKKSWVW